MKKEKCSKQKNYNSGFTLLELLVVVLIIGILTAIALPQYRLAVGKTKLAAIKDITKAIADAEELYYLHNGQYTDDPLKLEIDFKGATISGSNLKLNNGNYCYVWNISGNSGQKAVACYTKINKIEVAYYHHFIYSPRPNRRDCVVFSQDKTDTANKVCLQEIGKPAHDKYCSNYNGYCSYSY